MAEQIIQTLGFDAGQAITTIGTLNGSLDDLNKRLLTVTNAARKFNNQKVSKSLDKITRSSKSAAAALGKVGNQAGKVNKVSKSLNNASKSSANFVLSLQTLSRIALAQSIVRGLNLIQSELSEAVRTAVDFNLALTEAAAISPRGISNFKGEVASLNKELIETSKSFGFDVLDLAEAKYQEFSNQVKGSAQSTKLFVSANKLARISASGVGESVGALSSVLNSYDKGVEEADRVSAALFKTIELGRTRLSDIADQLGNVTPLARDAGISFEELGGSLATITRAGVSPSRALTQIRALINQLQKPSTELAKLFKEVFQVAGIEEAIAKFGGLQGVIEAVSNQAQGDSRKIAGFFTNIRARTAFISLTNQSERLSDSINQIRDAADNAGPFLQALLDEFDAQDAVKFTKAVNELKISFLELAQVALPALTSLLGVLSASVNNLAHTAGVLLVGAMVAYSFRLGAATVVTQGFAASTLGARAGVLGLAFALGFVLGEVGKLVAEKAALDSLLKTFEGIDTVTAENLKQIGIDAKTATDEIRALATSSQNTLKVLQDVSRNSQSAILQANNTFVSTLESSLGDLVKSRQNFVKSLEASITGLEGRITKRTEAGASIREEIADNEFERRLRGFDAIQKAFRRQERAEESLRKAVDSPTTNEGLEQRAKALERVKNLAEEALKAAEGTGNRAQVFRAEQLLSDVLKEQLSTKLLQNEEDKRSAKVAQSKLAAERASLNELKAAVKDFQANLSVFSDGGAVLGPEERDAAIKNAKEAFDRIQQLKFDAGDLSVGELLGSVDQQLRFNELLNQIKPEFTGIQEGIVETLKEVGKNNTLQIPIEFIIGEAVAQGLAPDIDIADAFVGLADLVKQTEDSLISLESKQNDFARASARVVGQQDKIKASVKEIRDITERIAREAAPFLGLRTDLVALDELDSKLEALAQKQFVTSEDIQNVRTLVEEFNNFGTGDIPGDPIFGERIFINQLIESFKSLQKAQGEALGGIANQTELQSAKDLLVVLEGQLKLQEQAPQTQAEVTKAIDNSKAAQTTLNGEQITSAGLVGGISARYSSAAVHAENLLRLQKALNRAQAAGTLPSSVTPRMHGGPIFRAFGGFVPRGTDTIPAMLSPGETVINARSSRQFASQISSMNAGVPPTYRAEGGVVNNSVNVADININGSGDAETTARLVAAQIKREFRRGTISRF